MDLQWLYNGYTMDLQWKRRTTKRRALATQYKRTRKRTRTKGGDEPEHKPASHHARPANRRGRAGRPASRQAKTAANREPNH